METIRNYLETMFINLPNTPEVQKAKYELWQMMEDKYAELKAEGKSENEAVGIVISEFGNLEELAEGLGIKSFMQTGNPVAGRHISMDEVKGYLRDKTKQAFMIALGVLLCIASPVGVIMGDSLNSRTANTFGLLFLFLTIAIAVGLFVFSGITMSRWDFFEQEPCNVDFETTSYVHELQEAYRTNYALMVTIGVIFCVICFVPLVLLDELNPGHYMLESFGVALLLVMVAIGVFLIVMASVKKGGYSTVLKLNQSGTVGASYVPSQGKKKYTNKTVAAVMSVYWPTVTCIYLCWSFISYDWHITWIIWVIAAIVETLIKNLYTE